MSIQTVGPCHITLDTETVKLKYYDTKDKSKETYVQHLHSDIHQPPLDRSIKYEHGKAIGKNNIQVWYVEKAIHSLQVADEDILYILTCWIILLLCLIRISHSTWCDTFYKKQNKLAHHHSLNRWSTSAATRVASLSLRKLITGWRTTINWDVTCILHMD
jgi:hypothetical protein